MVLLYRNLFDFLTNHRWADGLKCHLVYWPNCLEIHPVWEFYYGRRTNLQATYFEVLTIRREKISVMDESACIKK